MVRSEVACALAFSLQIITLSVPYSSGSDQKALAVMSDPLKLL